MYWHHGGEHMGWMGVWWVLITLLFVVVVWAAVTAAWRASGGRDSAEQVLKRRYARGEIDRETYDRMLQDVRK